MISLLAISLLGSLAMANERLDEAEQLYTQGQFEKARQVYRDAMAELPTLPPSFFYNFGTTAFHAGAIGEAYVLLTAASIASPLDKDTQKNLHLVHARLPATVKSIRPATWISWWPELARFFSWQAWLIVGLLAFSPFLWARRRGDAAAPWQLTLLLLSLFSLFFAAGEAWQARLAIGGITSSAKVLSGPGKTYPGISSLDPGSLVNVEESRDGWVKIRYLDSRLQDTVGWVESPTVLKFR